MQRMGIRILVGQHEEFHRVPDGATFIASHCQSKEADGEVVLSFEIRWKNPAEQRPKHKSPGKQAKGHQTSSAPSAMAE